MQVVSISHCGQKLWACTGCWRAQAGKSGLTLKPEVVCRERNRLSLGCWELERWGLFLLLHANFRSQNYGQILKAKYEWLLFSLELVNTTYWIPGKVLLGNHSHVLTRTPESTCYVHSPAVSQLTSSQLNCLGMSDSVWIHFLR